MKRLLVLLLVLACGKSATTAAKGLAYANPSGSGWRLVKSASSTPSLLVLDLLPPAGDAGRGVALTLRADPRLGWAATDTLRPGAVYDLGAAPKAMMAELRGQDAVLGLFQKGQTAPASYGDGTRPVLSVALSLGALQQPPQGTALPLEIKLARHLSATGQLEDLSGKLQVGALSAE